jgi:hypothetical protein
MHNIGSYEWSFGLVDFEIIIDHPNNTGWAVQIIFVPHTNQKYPQLTCDPAVGTDTVLCPTVSCGIMNCCKIYPCASWRYTEVTFLLTFSQQGQSSLRLLVVNSLYLSWPFASFIERLGHTSTRFHPDTRWDMLLNQWTSINFDAQYCCFLRKKSGMIYQSKANNESCRWHIKFRK